MTKILHQKSAGNSSRRYIMSGMDRLPRRLSHNRFLNILKCCASQPIARAEVIRNHDNNLWWPREIEDWRLRMVIAGWSTRVSYRMITTYQGVVDAVHDLGYDRLSTLTDNELRELVRPLGLFSARIGYFRSLQRFIKKSEAKGVNPKSMTNDDLIESLTKEVHGAGYKVAQCAALYAKGYHCGIMPVDSGMKDMLGPCLGLQLPPGPRAHEVMRRQLEELVKARPGAYRRLALRTGYAELDIPSNRAPSWWTHLVLVYYKRLYCNKREPHGCALREDGDIARYIGTMCSPIDPRPGKPHPAPPSSS